MIAGTQIVVVLYEEDIETLKSGRMVRSSADGVDIKVLYASRKR